MKIRKAGDVSFQTIDIGTEENQGYEEVYGPELNPLFKVGLDVNEMFWYDLNKLFRWYDIEPLAEQKKLFK